MKRKVDLDGGRLPQVHVWRLVLFQMRARSAALLDVLSDDEIEIAERKRSEYGYADYVASHGALRVLLALYLEADPASLRIARGPYGKPYVDVDYQADAIHFNLSHSKDMALVSIASGMTLGVDIEFMRTDIDYMQIAQRFFTRQERRKLERLPCTLQQEAFYRCWARKEAYIKGKGIGLALALDRFEVTADANELPRLVRSDDYPHDSAHWQLHDLHPAPGYAAALAVRGAARLECFDYCSESTVGDESAIKGAFSARSKDC